MIWFLQRMQARLLCFDPSSAPQLPSLPLSADDAKTVIGVGSDFLRLLSHWIFGPQLARTNWRH
jgi:hypothetical protein